nr:hypothetical protein [Enterobacter cloacae]
MVSRLCLRFSVTNWHCDYHPQSGRHLNTAIEYHNKHLPAGALVVVVDDGSKPAAVVPDGVQLLRHEKSLGIVASKNASLSALMDAGCVHLFWDDDAWAIADTRADVMAFSHGIIRLYYRSQSYRFWKKEQAGAAEGDMLAFGIVAQSFADRLVTGPQVHNVFKTDGIGDE